MSPIGVGFPECDADGLFHFQRLQLMSEVRCISGPRNGHDALQVPGASQRGFSQSTTDILSDPETSLVWTPADPNLVSARAVLAAGKHVLLGVPSEVSSDVWRQFIAAVRGTARNLFVTALHRWDGQFQTVRAQVAAPDLGALVEVRRISRQFVPGELCGAQAGSSAVDSPLLHDRETRAFQMKWFEMLDELLLLVPSLATSVWARPTRSGRSVWVTFADGCRAWLELDRRSLAPLETGWILEGTTGGYAAGRRFRAAGDYELVDVPVEQLPTDQDAFYNSLVATIRDGEPFSVTCESILQVLVLRDAIETSIRKGQAVNVAKD